MTKYHIFDTETTDLIKNMLTALKNQPHVIEYFGQDLVVDKKGAKVMKPSLTFLCKPPLAITPEITRITTITNDMLADCEAFRFYAEKVKAKIEKADKVVAHNLSFDKGMIDNEMKRCGLKIDWPPGICTVESTEWIKGHRLSLTALHQYLFDEPFKNAHRAKGDVDALTRCFIELLKRGLV